MPTCRNCGLPLTHQPDGNYKCSICGFTFKPGSMTPLMSKFAPANIKQVTNDQQELEVFLRRVVEKLVPIYKDYPEHTKRVLRGNRLKLRSSLVEVLEGKNTFQHWFEKIHRDFGKHPVDIGQLLYDCTEGLKTKEAQELRKGCEQFLNYVTTLYNPSLMAGGGPPQ